MGRLAVSLLYIPLYTKLLYKAENRCIRRYIHCLTRVASRPSTAIQLYSAIQRCILYSYTVLYTIQPLQHPSELELTLLCCECALCCPLLRCCLLFLRSNSYLARISGPSGTVYRRPSHCGWAASCVHRGPCTSSRFDTPLLLYLYTFYTAPHVPTRWLVPARVRAPHGIAQQNGEYKYGKALAPGPPRL